MHLRSLRLATPLLLALAVAACGAGANAPEMQGPPPVGVNVAEVESRSITQWDDFSGRIEAVETVDLRPRVSGYLDAVHFEEGRKVSQGELLFTIDAREFKAAVDSQKANLTRAKTRVQLAEQELARSQKLIDARAISQEELEQRRGEQQQALADVQAAQAQLARAELDLEFTRIVAPIDGVIGAALIRPGNLVSAGNSVLATLVSVDPVYVTFEGDERIYLRYQQQDRDGERGSSRVTPNPVLVGLADEEGYPHRGVMNFVDNRLDPATGTIRGRATLANPDGRFTPGLFARLRLLGATEQPALLLHEQAVLTDQDRQYVYVVGDDNTAQRRDIVLGPNVEGLRIVESGLGAGDRVIVNGVRKIFFPGAPVIPNPVPMDQPNLAPPPPPAQGTAAPSQG